MPNQELEKRLKEVVKSEQLYVQEPMKKHTTFRIGGVADYFVMPESVQQLREVIQACRELQTPYFILGNGSNLLVGDKGYRGVMIQLFKNFSEVTVEGNCIRAQAGALLSRVAKCALEEQLTGMEFAAGIPGTIGGAVVMNAGAYDGEMSQILKEAVILDEQGELRTLSVCELELGYRTSVLQRRAWTVVEVLIQLQQGEHEKIQTRMDELKQQRISKQPLEYPSAGSTFKRPEGSFAGKLIMEAGFRGYQIGGARVSDKHCGFVINTGNATAADVIELTDCIRDKVQQDTGIRLELEVCRVGSF